MQSWIPQSPSELRQELIAEQFLRGQSDPELKKYLKRSAQIFQPVTPTHLHRPAEQTFAVHQQVETPLPYAEECDDSEDVFAMDK